MKVTELNNTEARQFFLKGKNYCNIDLPSYFTFNKLLSGVDKIIGSSSLKDFYNSSSKPKYFEGVNYFLFSNKDGHFAWRPFQLIHPAIYVSLVNKICTQKNWEEIVKRFNKFETSKVDCISIPVQSKTKNSDKAEIVKNWYSNFENKSIAMGLKYQYMLETDITDCYGSIYTHSIAWALHGKKEAKEKKTDPDLIGNIIDRHIQDMSYAQTNGIPQGSVLMDFIAEMVLGYADEELTKSLEVNSINDIEILRYRDDYRIFSNNPQTLEVVAKYLTEILVSLGLKINSIKTYISNNLIKDAVKPDKLFWINNKQTWDNYQKRLYYLHSFAATFPNSGTLVTQLFHFYKDMKSKKSIKKDLVVISSIVVDIMYKNPRVYPQCTAILSKVLDMLDFDNAKNILNLILERFKFIPNTTLLNIWLQRITHLIDPTIIFDDKICNKVIDANVCIWESAWLSSNLKKFVDETDIINREEFKQLSKVVHVKEIQLFDPYSE